MRASKEEGEALVDDANITILEVLINEQGCHEVACLAKLWVLLNRNSALLDDALAEVSESLGVPLLITLEWRDVVAS